MHYFLCLVLVSHYSTQICHLRTRPTTISSSPWRQTCSAALCHSWVHLMLPMLFALPTLPLQANTASLPPCTTCCCKSPTDCRLLLDPVRHGLLSRFVPRPFLISFVCMFADDGRYHRQMKSQVFINVVRTLLQNQFWKEDVEFA